MPLLGIYPKEMKTNLKRYMHAPLYTLQHYDTQGMETTKVSINI